MILTLSSVSTVFQNTLGSYLFASLSNGTMVVYHANPMSSPEDWACQATIDIGGNTNLLLPVRNGKEMWVSCDNSLRVVDTTDFTLTPGIISVDGSQQCVTCIEGQGDKVWCSMKSSSCVYEYSTRGRELVRVIRCQSNDEEIINEMNECQSGNKEIVQEVTALLVVKDALWIGKNTGSILVIGIENAEVPDQESEISAVGVLEVNRIIGKPRGEVTQLRRVGKDRVVACIVYQHDEGHDMRGYLAIWDSWGLADFQRFEHFKNARC